MATSLQTTYFVSVDELLVFNWLKCMEGKLEFMRRDLSHGAPETDVMAWREFLADHLTRIGLSNQQQRFNLLKEKHTFAILRWVAEEIDSPRKPMYFMEAEQIQDELDFFLQSYGNDNEEGDESMKVGKTLARLSNRHKRSINSRNTTVMELHILSQLED